MSLSATQPGVGRSVLVGGAATDGAGSATHSGPTDWATLRRFSERHYEPSWLRDLRSAWWQRYQDTPLPSGQEEEWRRTPLADLPRNAELLLDAPATELDHDADLAARGVIFTDLRTAVREHPELVRAHLGIGEPVESHAAFWALSLAAWTAGTFLYVPRGVEVDGTLIARLVTDRADVAFVPHTIVAAEPGASVTVLEELVSADGAAGWFGGTVEIHAQEGSRIRYARLQRLGDGVWNIGAQRVVVGTDAEVTTLNAEVGSRVTKVGLDVQMTGRGGVSRVLGLLAAGGDQHIDINSVQELVGSHTTSDLLYLAALYDRAHAAFYGRIVVRPGAKQTSSYQECRNLLLSPGAGAEPIPVLEIETNDILRCGHGATAGAIDPVQLFYAQSRGLDADEAERMIVRGFFEQVVGQISSETIKALVLDALARRIGSSTAFDEADEADAA
ncbi:MAG: Fe-S cluster assembly protein SufD [Chloroflexi bacterium]|nr:MAG: Fe-S cluster assembly protein SufD [Chloroflexota bacterium]